MAANEEEITYLEGQLENLELCSTFDELTEIRQELVRLARAGAAVLLVSADLNEVMELSDSLMVFHNGAIAAYFEDTAELTDEIMGEYMLGLKKQDAEQIGRVCHE